MGAIPGIDNCSWPAAIYNVRQQGTGRESIVAARKIKKQVVIVESPAKAKTIQKYLGSDFEVTASKGHIRDLPKSRLGIDIEGGWVPTYRPLADRKLVLASLKKSVKGAGMVYLAPDPDREGEAIAWHLQQALDLPDEKVRRVTFNEITRTAVQEAFSRAGSINTHRVEAQEARRFLDRIVGYNLSPLLSRRLARQLSAGRVQSVAVKLVVDREREISAFVAEEFWKVEAMLAIAGTADRAKLTGDVVQIVTVDPNAKKRFKKGSDEEDEGNSRNDETPEGAFRAEMVSWAGEKFEASERAQIENVVANLDGATWVVSRLEEKEKQERPPAPFTTSTLQQQSSLRLGYAASRTMRIAQRLYEGVELGSEGQVALITYMRTDSTRVSNEALTAVRGRIQSEYGARYLPEKPHVYSSGKSAQEAHEAIRPTDLSYTPARLASQLPAEQLRLYTMIYQRFVASQMKPAVFSVTTVEVSASKAVFRASGRILRFDGFRKVMPISAKNEEPQLPALTNGQDLDLMRLVGSQHFTQPPPRFNEASLVKMLEKEGIGRPSTYASIISKIQERAYVEQRERRFFATEIGMQVTDLLVEHFKQVMDLKFTSHMEEQLDRIETEDLGRNVVLDEFFGPFSEAMRQAESVLGGSQEACPQCGKPISERFSRRGRFFGCSGYPECNFIKRPEGQAERVAPEVTEHACPVCTKPMLKRMGKGKPFLGCSGYPECKTTMNLDPDGNPVLASKVTEHLCDKCKSPMILRTGRRGPFLACSAYPKCKHAVDVDAEGNPKQPVSLGINCEKCSKPMAIKRGPRGPFLGCSGYPECRTTKQITPELRDQLKDHLPPAKPAPPAVEINEVCPKCSKPLKVRSGAKGYFLGCTGYPKCRTAVEPSAELLERINAAAASAEASPA
jgi:DNA topoisomerase-1